MRVIFAGTAGLAKDDAMRKIAEHCRRQMGWTDDFSRTEHRAHILPLVFEEELLRQHHSITTILDSFNDQMRTLLWHEAFRALSQRIERAEPEHVFLSIHLSLYRHSSFFTFTDWQDLRSFAPDLIVTLIDDAHDAWARIKAKTEQSPDRTVVTLKELYAWRSVETFFAEQLSRNLSENDRIPHYVTAVKHPLEMFHKLIFQEEVPRIYASYPISRVRADAEVVGEVNGARARLHERFTVFDPVTIDERIMLAKLVSGPVRLQEPEEVAIDLSDRWPLRWDECAAPPPDLYPIRVPTTGVRALGAEVGRGWVWQDIDDNIRWRDFALINQAQGVLAYRPRHGNQEPSRGGTRELNYALDTRIIPCHIYSPEEDGDFDTSPFSPSAVVHGDFDEAIAGLEHDLRRQGG